MKVQSIHRIVVFGIHFISYELVDLLIFVKLPLDDCLCARFQILNTIEVYISDLFIILHID